MAIKAFSECNQSPSKAVSALIYPSKTSSLDTGDYADNDFKEVSKGRYLVDTDDVLDEDEVSKCRGGIPALQIVYQHCSQAQTSTSSQTRSLSNHKTVCTLLEYYWLNSTLLFATW